MGALWEAIVKLWNDSGLVRLFNFEAGGWKNLIMIGIACVLIYLAVKKGFEPLLLLPIAFGMLLVNLPLSGIMDPQRNSLVPLTPEELEHLSQGIYDQVYPVFEQNGQYYWQHFENGGLMWYLYQGVKFGIYPPLIFLGIGCMTDFGPLISNPRSFLLGAAAQLGIFITFFGARLLDMTGIEVLSFNCSRRLPWPSSAVLTGRQQFISPPSWRRSCLVRLRLRHIHIWRWCRLSSRRS